MSILLGKECSEYRNKDENPNYGKGKWVLVDIDYDGFQNAGTVAWKSVAFVDENKFTLSDPRVWEGTTRTVILEWQPLDGFENSAFYPTNETHRYGSQKRVKQKYIYGIDHWAIGGYSHYWSPPVGWYFE